MQRLDWFHFDVGSQEEELHSADRMLGSQAGDCSSKQTDCSTFVLTEDEELTA